VSDTHTREASVASSSQHKQHQQCEPIGAGQPLDQAHEPVDKAGCVRFRFAQIVRVRPQFPAPDLTAHINLITSKSLTYFACTLGPGYSAVAAISTIA
jgi:hypothetical protein